MTIKMTISILFLPLLFQFVICSESEIKDEEIVIMPFESVVILGRNILLSCHIKSQIENCTWKINGVLKDQEAFIEHKKFRSEIFSKCILEIESLTGDDVGQWTCYLTDNEGIERRKSITLSLKTPYGLYTVLFIGLFLGFGYTVGCFCQKKYEGAKWKPTTSEIPLPTHSENHTKLVYGRSHPSLTPSSSNKSEVFLQPHPKSP